MAARTERAGLKGAVVAAGVLLLGLGPARANEPPRFEQLTAANVTRILQQAVVAARASSTPASVAVVDRVGNVLAVYVMNGAPDGIASQGRAPSADRPAGWWGFRFPPDSFLAAPIAKAITGAYLSSGGNAFTTRTASQIIQENYNPLSSGLEGGPLFGVQFSQLPCSDLSVRFATNNTDNPGVVDPTIGPKRSPLGFAGDPGGLPLYKNGTLVGGVGVFSDGVYGLARPKDADGGSDEAIALAATTGFGAPEQIRGNRIVVDGRTLTFTNSRALDSGALANAGAVDLATAGVFQAVRGYYDGGGPLDGQPFGFRQSGILPDPDNLFQSDQGVHPCRCHGRQPLSATRRQWHHRRRGHGDPALGAWGDAASSCPDPAAARQLRRGDDLGRRRRRQYCRARAHARCAGVRHRRLAAEGAQHAVLLERRGVQRPADLAAGTCRASFLAPTSERCRSFWANRSAAGARSRPARSAILPGPSIRMA